MTKAMTLIKHSKLTNGSHSLDCLQHLSISATIRLGIYLLIDVLINIDLGVLRLCGDRQNLWKGK